MKLSNEGRMLIERHEGRRNTAYRDAAGLWTIGIGHLIKPAEAYMRDSILTDAQINELFAADVLWAEQAVERLFPKVKRQNQFDALVSFTYNLGEGAVRNGTLDDLINQGASPEAISAKWMEYTRAGDRVVAGLVTRRTAEVKYYWQHLWKVPVWLLVLASACMLAAAINTATA